MGLVQQLDTQDTISEALLLCLKVARELNLKITLNPVSQGGHYVLFLTLDGALFDGAYASRSRLAEGMTNAAERARKKHQQAVRA